MPEDHNTDSTKHRLENRPSEEFEAYCRTEFEHRLNSGKDFDAQAFREAAEMALHRLRVLEDGDL